MTKTLQFKSWLLALCLVLGVGSAWADTYSLTPDQTSTGSNATSYLTTLTEFTYNGISWKMNQWNPKNLQIKTNQSSAASEFRFYNTSAFSGRITKVVITFKALTVSDASKLMFLGGTSEVTATTGGTAGTWDSTHKTLTWTPGATDDFTYFAFYQNGKAASGTNYLAESDAIVVTYESGETPSTKTATTTTIVSTGITNTDVYVGTAAGQLTATVGTEEAAVAGATVTWSSSEPEVATIDANGNVTLVAAGTTTITASYAGDDTYAASSATYQLTVTDTTPETGSWVKTALTDLAAGDIFVIVGNNGSNYAMTNDKGTTSAPAATAVTITDDMISGTVADKLKWNISGNATDGYTFYPDGSTTTWLYCTNNNNGLRVGTGDDKAFAIKDGYIYNNGQSRYIGVYNSADWRSYTSINNNITGQTFAFYKYVDATAPLLTANDVELTYDATSGTITYTLTNATADGALTAASSKNWLTVGTPADGSIALTCEANSTATERTANVTLTYTYDTDKTVVKTITVTQAANPNATMTIAEVRAQQTGSVTTKGVVTSVSGKTAYLQDATAAICVYGSSDLEVAIGDEIEVSGTLSTYNGLLEITNPTIETLSNGNTVLPEDMTIAQVLTAEKQGWLVKIVKAEVTEIDGSNTTIKQGESMVVVRGISGVEYAVSDLLTFNANIGAYNGVQLVNPTDVTVEQNLNPSIHIENTTIETTATGAEGTINVTYQNFTFDADMAEIQFCDAEGNKLSEEPEWIVADFDADGNIEYVIEENPATEARTAYLKVYALDDEANEVYSDLITVTQAKMTVDYATLPFKYDGNAADLSDVDGLTQSGVGVYNTAPKMKFDTTGDYLVLKLNEAPGFVSFDIKANPGSGSWAGTFTVQTSADGENYTDLAAYTELTNSTENKFLLITDANVRYIKWIYTTKTSGNVALGNIYVDREAATATMTIGAAKYGTFIAPFAVEIPEGVTATKVTGVEGTKLTEEEVEGTIPANTPVVLYSETEVNEEFTGVNVATQDTYTVGLLTGVYTEVEAEDGWYVLQNHDGQVGFYKVDTTKATPHVKANRAYLTAPAGSEIKAFFFGDTDAIEGVKAENEQQAIYNLAGQRVQKAVKGIYIVNGKKVLK